MLPYRLCNRLLVGLYQWPWEACSPEEPSSCLAQEGCPIGTTDWRGAGGHSCPPGGGSSLGLPDFAFTHSRPCVPVRWFTAPSCRAGPWCVLNGVRRSLGQPESVSESSLHPIPHAQAASPLPAVSGAPTTCTHAVFLPSFEVRGSDSQQANRMFSPTHLGFRRCWPHRILLRPGGGCHLSWNWRGGGAALGAFMQLGSSSPLGAGVLND